MKKILLLIIISFYNKYYFSKIIQLNKEVSLDVPKLFFKVYDESSDQFLYGVGELLMV